MMSTNEAANLVDACYDTCDEHLPPKLEQVVKQIQLDAMREGMRRAAAIIKDHWNNSETICNQRDQASRSSHVLLESAESLTDQDIAATTGTTLAK